MYIAHSIHSAKWACHQQNTVEDHEDGDEDGILMDIDIQPITDESGPTHEDRTHDIDEFFGKHFECMNTNGIWKNTASAKFVHTSSHHNFHVSVSFTLHNDS
jgi:hypothetical protein